MFAGFRPARSGKGSDISDERDTILGNGIIGGIRMGKRLFPAVVRGSSIMGAHPSSARGKTS
jgi:hypothetical protein